MQALLFASIKGHSSVKPGLCCVRKFNIRIHYEPIPSVAAMIGSILFLEIIIVLLVRP